MAKAKEFTVGHGMTISFGTGFESDKPYFSMTVELEPGDDFQEEVNKAIKTVNETLLEIAGMKTEEESAAEPSESKAA